MTESVVVLLILLLIALSTAYNAYLLRGGKLIWSQILITLGMISLIFSLISPRFLPEYRLIGDLTLPDVLFVLGFVLLLLASLKTRFSLK